MNGEEEGGGRFGKYRYIFHHFPFELQTRKMEVKHKHILIFSVLAISFLSYFILIVSGEARRGGGRRAKVLWKNNSIKPNITDNVAIGNKGRRHRQGKLFSLFNVVQFKNDPCTSSELITGSDRSRNGTCHTTTECSDKGGQAEGNCAAGFGVCCIFVIDATEGNNVVNYNCTYIQNEGFNTPLNAAGTHTYTINRCSEDVCSLRLDFETFNIAGTDTEELDSACADESFVIMADTAQQIPVICGQNSGQHMYIDMGGTATLTFNVAEDTTAVWDVKVSQIECNNPSLPPDGCLQYHDSITGRIQTFNFDNANQNHLDNQDYSVCVRQESGFCCVQYQTCRDIMGGSAFSLASENGGGVVIPTAQDNECINRDHVSIPESSAICDQTSHLSVDSRYCGQALSNDPGAEISAPVCACNPPFTVRIFTNDMPDSNIANDGNLNILSRGLCLEYMQIPCAF